MTDVVLGMKITADGKIAVGEIDKVDGKFVQLGKTSKLTAEQLKTLSDAGNGLVPAFVPVPKVVDDTSKSFDRNAISAKQMAFAMRGVPAQFTDIFTSLAAGQRPMQVFMQQGGQLKDMFGGAGPAAKALGGYVMGLINPFTVAAVAVGGFAVASELGRRESDAMAKALIMSGNAAGTTSGQMQGLSVDIAAATGATRGAAAEALTLAATTGNITAANLGRVASAAVSMERIAGVAIEDTVKQFDALGKSPVAASLKLNETTGFLTSSVYLQIKALEDQGRMLEAGALAQNAWASVIEQRTPAMEANLGALEKGWRAVGDVAKGTWDAMLDVGREGSVEVKLAQVNKLLTAAAADGNQIRIKALAAEATALQQQIAAKAPGTEAADKAAQAQLKATVAWQTESDKLRSTAQVREAEIVRIRSLGLAAGKSELEIEKLIAAAKDKYKDKTPPKDKAYESNEHKLAMANIAIQKALQKELEKTGDAAVAAGLDGLSATQPWNDALDAQIEKINEETFTLTASAEQIREHTIALALQNSGLKEGSEEWQRYGESMRGAIAGLDAAKAAKRFRDEESKYWQDFAGDIRRNVGDGIYRGLEQGGKDGGKIALDAVKRAFKAAPIKLAVDATLNIVGGAIQGLLGGGSAGGAGGGGGLGGLFNAASTANSAWSVASSAGSAVMKAGSFFGSESIAGFGAGMNPAYASLAADGLGGYSAAGASAASAGSTLATAAPYVAALLVAYSLLSSKGGGPKTEGGYSNASGIGGLMPSQNQMGGSFGSTGKSLVEGVAADYANIIRLFDKTPGALTGGAFVSTDPSGTANTQLFQTAALNGQLVYDRNAMFGGVENVGRSDSELQSALAQSSGLAIIAALEATEGLPKIVETYLDSIRNTKLTAEEAAAAINQVKFYDQVLDAVDLTKSFAGFAKADALAAMSEFNRFLDNTDTLRDAARDFDGSLNSASALAAATNAMYTDQLALVRQIRDAAQATHDSFASSQRSVALDVLDNEGKYNFYGAEAERYRDVIKTLTDPAAISEYADKLNSSMLSAWNLLDPTQKASNATQFSTLFGEADTLTGNRFNAAESQVKTLTTELSGVIKTVFAEMIEKAVTEITKAKTPLAITIPDLKMGVTINSVTPARSELTSFEGGGVTVYADIGS